MIERPELRHPFWGRIELGPNLLTRRYLSFVSLFQLCALARHSMGPFFTWLLLGLLVDSSHTGHIGTAPHSKEAASNLWVDAVEHSQRRSVKHVEPFLQHIICPHHTSLPLVNSDRSEQCATVMTEITEILGSVDF